MVAMGKTIKDRAASYDLHYRTAGWQSHRWTRETIEARLAYALYVDKGGCLNGNEIGYALRATGAPELVGRRVLDYCCGTGITAIYFALCGAEVWAFDASSEALHIAVASAQMSGVVDRVHFAVVDAQVLPYENDFFDVVFCQSALHIIIDYPSCPIQLSRVLKCGGRAIFCDEGLGYNPLLRPIRWLRRRAWIRCGGRPLTYPDIEQFGKPFSQTEIQHFNLLTQVKSAFRRQLHRHGCLRPWSRRLLMALEKADTSILAACPRLKKYCGAVAVSFVK
jgi:SAM-dependent methyltransferase